MKKRVIIIAAIVLVAVSAAIVAFFLQSEPRASINDDCFDWEFPAEVEIERYDPCSSLTLIKVTDGREIKANFVLTRPPINGGKDSFLGKTEVVSVEDNAATRYLYDGRDSDNGLGTYHIDYSIFYDRLPLKSEKSDGRTLLAAEFVLATKNDTHVSDQEVSEFIELTDQIMDALNTK